MIAAPGKLFTTGAWAILEGAPAVIFAVDRYALADAGTPSSRPEVVAVARLLGRAVPSVDVSAMEDAGRKLGLGSSAAAAVAAAGALMGLADRGAILDVALRAHGEVQPRGSGGDVAAATYGGAVIVRRGERLRVDAAEVPRGLCWRAFALPRSARTSDALDRLAERRGRAASALSTLCDAAERGADAVVRGEVSRFLDAAARHVAGLESLGAALDLPLVPPEVSRARDVLQAGDVAGSWGETVLLPSGAGGGDTLLWLSARAPTEQDVASLSALGLTPLELSLDRNGVHETKSPRN